VQTEYYLQYADHYYRILGESRARFEEQRRQRGDSDDDEGDDDQMEAGDDPRSQDDDGDDDRSERNDRPDRDERYERDRPPPRESRERFERPERNARPERSERAERNEQPERPSRPAPADRNLRRPRYATDGNGDDAGDRQDGDNSRGGNLESISFDALPPAIGRDPPAVEADAEVEAPRPKRRAARKPRPADDEGDIAPAA
jgi:hypothetical protein